MRVGVTVAANQMTQPTVSSTGGQ